MREGDDLITALDVAAPLAALGATLEIPTLEGTGTIELPAGTQPGEVLTLRGEGMPSLRRGRRGDLRVVVNVVIPRRLSAEQRELARAAQRQPHRGEPALAGVDVREAAPRAGQPGRVIRLAVRVPREQAELVLAELLELAPAGVEEIERRRRGRSSTPSTARPASCPALPDLDAVVGEALVEISTSEIADDWEERWKQFHRPVLIAAPTPPRRHGDGAVPVRCTCARRGRRRSDGRRRRRPRDRDRPRPGVRHGRAREHAPVPGAAARARRRERRRGAAARRRHRLGRARDRGRGARLRARARPRQRAARACRPPRENATVNGVQIEVRRFDLRTESLPWLDEPQASGAAPVMLANLLRPLLLELAATMPAAPAHLIAGGLLDRGGRRDRGRVWRPARPARARAARQRRVGRPVASAP